MIKAEHKLWARVLLNLYLGYIFKNSFSNFYLVNDPPGIPENKSLVITPNHISWWDGFFIDRLSKHTLNKKLHLMMLESSLEKFWFFSKVGAFSINPGNAASVAQTFSYTRDLLLDNNNMVVTYPQGEIEPFEKRPLSLKGGIASLLKPLNNKTVLMPVGFKIEYYDQRKPAVYCRFGPLLGIDEIVYDKELYEKEFIKNLDLLSEAAGKRKFVRDLF
jgi:1-acyl-sn-glycerol-3-phosphate acyltransferase